MDRHDDVIAAWTPQSGWTGDKPMSEKDDKPPGDPGPEVRAQLVTELFERWGGASAELSVGEMRRAVEDLFFEGRRGVATAPDPEAMLGRLAQSFIGALEQIRALEQALATGALEWRKT